MRSSPGAVAGRSVVIDAGVSESFVKNRPGGRGTPNHGVVGRIDPSDHDGRVNDCVLRQAANPGSSGDIDVPTVSQVAAHRGRLTLSGVAKNGLIRLSPSINWNLALDLDTTGRSTRVTVSGRRGGVPAYEIYINRQSVYQFATTGLTAAQLPALRFGLLDLGGLYVSQTITPVRRVLT